MYNPARVAAISVVDETRTTSYLLGLFETQQVITAESLPVEIKLYAKELYALAAQARKEQRYGVSGAEPV